MKNAVQLDWPAVKSENILILCRPELATKCNMQEINRFVDDVGKRTNFYSVIFKWIK